MAASYSFNDGGFIRRRQGMGGRKLAMDVLPEDKMAFRLMLEASQGHGTGSNLFPVTLQNLQGMAGVREWLQNKFSSLELVQAVNKSSAIESKQQQNTPAPMIGVITPETVPNFVIPSAKFRAVRNSQSLSAVTINNNHNTQQIHMCRCHSKGASCGELSALTGSCSNRIPESAESSHTLVLSAPLTGSRRSSRNGFFAAGDALHSADGSGLSGEESGTNDDPGSAAAVSIPHLRTSTPYGFTTLMESPHTRRKESLLLGSASFEDVKKLHNSVSGRIGLSSGSNQSSRHTLSVPVARLHSLSNSSTSLVSDRSVSPLDSPLLSRSISRETKAKRKYERRRSSAHSQQFPLSESDGSASGDAFHTSLQSSMSKVNTQSISMLGEIKLSLLYDRHDATLKLLVIKAEDLGRHQLVGKNVNAFIKVCMLPHKTHRHESAVMRSTQNPHFNQQFMFSSITIANLQVYHLRLRVCNRIASRKYETLGEVVLPLHTLGLEHEEEVRMWRDLDPKSLHQELGKLDLAIRFEPREDSLQVRIQKVSGLPKYALTGPPDCYVKVIVRQEGKPTVKKQTKIRKNTSHPVYNDTFAFSISPRIDDLRYTSITILVMSHQTLRTDSIIGEVVLGYGSTEEDEYSHWSNILNSTDNFVACSHHLKPASKARFIT